LTVARLEGQIKLEGVAVVVVTSDCVCVSVSVWMVVRVLAAVRVTVVGT
jgi:hypothetical protein